VVGASDGIAGIVCCEYRWDEVSDHLVDHWIGFVCGSNLVDQQKPGVSVRSSWHEQAEEGAVGRCRKQEVFLPTASADCPHPLAGDFYYLVSAVIRRWINLTFSTFGTVKIHLLGFSATALVFWWVYEVFIIFSV
jgi:hypothetical protein